MTSWDGGGVTHEKYKTSLPSTTTIFFAQYLLVTFLMKFKEYSLFLKMTILRVFNFSEENILQVIPDRIFSWLILIDAINILSNQAHFLFYSLKTMFSCNEEKMECTAVLCHSLFLEALLSLTQFYFPISTWKNTAFVLKHWFISLCKK